MSTNVKQHEPQAWNVGEKIDILKVDSPLCTISHMPLYVKNLPSMSLQIVISTMRSRKFFSEFSSFSGFPLPCV